MPGLFCILILETPGPNPERTLLSIREITLPLTGFLPTASTDADHEVVTPFACLHQVEGLARKMASRSMCLLGCPRAESDHPDFNMFFILR